MLPAKKTMSCRKIPSEFDRAIEFVKKIDPYGVLEIQDHMMTPTVTYEICFDGRVIALELPYQFLDLCRSDNLGKFIEEFSISSSKRVMPLVTAQSHAHGVERFEEVVCWTINSTQVRRFSSTVFTAITSLHEQCIARFVVRPDYISFRVYCTQRDTTVLLEKISISNSYVPREFSVSVMREGVTSRVVQRGDVELLLSYDPFGGDYSPENVEKCWKHTALATLLK